MLALADACRNPEAWSGLTRVGGQDQPAEVVGIRVNSVAPGPVWTPLIPATFDADKVGSFGGQVPMGRAAQPDEIAPSYVFFASGRLSSYYSGEVLAPIGGETLPG